MTGLGPQWRRILAAAAAAMEQGHRSFSISSPDTGERHLISGITGIHRRGSARTLRVPVDVLEAYVRADLGVDLARLVHRELGIEVGAARRVRLRRVEEVDRIMGEAGASRLARFDWFTDWLESLRANGTVAALAGENGSLMPMVRVLEALPADDEPLPVLSERLLGDTKALASGRARTMLLRALAHWRGIDHPDDAEARRELLEWAGIVSDDIASQVLVLNTPIEGGVVGEWMRSAVGIPFRLTLQQLRRQPVKLTAAAVRVVENPSVLRTAADRLGRDCPPMVCTEGVPSAALYRFLGSATDARILWRADFDWAGLRIVQRGLQRFATAEPWRMSAADYGAAPTGIALRGNRIETPWDPALSAAMAAAGRAVMEESLLPVLLDDLRSG